jgi:hypothetical protein
MRTGVAKDFGHFNGVGWLYAWWLLNFEVMNTFLVFVLLCHH